MAIILVYPEPGDASNVVCIPTCHTSCAQVPRPQRLPLATRHWRWRRDWMALRRAAAVTFRMELLEIPWLIGYERYTVYIESSWSRMWKLETIRTKWEYV